MELKWTSKALSDLARLYEFLAPVNRQAATKVVQNLTKTVSTLPGNSRIGEQLFQFSPREVRRILAGEYEIRYEVLESRIYVLRLWHSRENR